ncbi:UDP-N-acetylmuramoyl-L-alanyl-D-glutamate--2,6-diaminopimelate ligase [Taibaiella sp. KBW10]|uniref:UDP-N-acetylmuramoyl-L-alanyl-D-glutamate--2, 6-diaminopimelate ligase n=1 Tax=Taibaiella sp. KBW10 TaxID=2153357 RepID=UPI000F5952BA|nr:UDP-N-acetylmuramoyl-L-alanyl-D-glutamate--2,6-diaminopimelate ligase [Taibaiella sp. KBW10]RQO30462.1 UDP-N-acetylmuramoyl-L-alanyl-D-glutamate--2,6-diaminopimelate ligase [Taibaiella sp. KBW10]
MKRLKELIQEVSVISIQGHTDIAVNELIIDSRKAKPGALFFAQKGTLTDGHQYIPAVIEAGAVAIVCSQLPDSLSPEVTYIQVADVSAVVGIMAAAFYDHPTKKLKVIGVTGTNGKTTVATLLYKLFNELGETSGLVSTVENKIGAVVAPATHTTPDAISLQALFRQMADQGCSYAFMEVSSHAIHQHRIGGTHFQGGIFTNITHDHLDYHKTFDEYIRVKKQFFDHLPKTAFALTNIDDKRGMVMLQNTKALKKAYGLRIPCDVKGRVFENNLTGLIMSVDGQDVHFRMSGLFNAYNLLAVYGAAILCGKDKIDVLTALSNMQGAAGRFETYHSAKENILGIVDYAHTPDALQNVLSTIKQFGQQANIITVIGCGGDRDTTKRSEMAKVACDLSYKAILTSDNPRSEDPEAILDDMEAGLTPGQMRKALRISDRKAAIKTAVSMAQEHDVILIAGKGHETYQEIKGVRQHFDDKEVLLEMFNLLDK